MIKELERLWDKLEIRLLVMSSLVIQILLFILAVYRKRVVSIRLARTTNSYLLGPVAHMFHWFLWLAYLLADYVATVGLAYLRESEDGRTQHLVAFWAPFFLLHLGGQDTMTALSIEDNELWSRHLLTLLAQATLALYNFFRSNLHAGELWPPATLIFAVGCFKYGERTWALQRASMSALRSSMITKPDPGPNYAIFMQEYTSSRAAGLGAIIQRKEEKHHKTREVELEIPGTGNEIHPEYKEIVCKAYEFFPTFKRLFVDLILSYKNREDSQRYFIALGFEPAFELIEIELSWMYNMLHSKASVIYTIKYYGWVSRAITMVIITGAFIMFAMSNHSGYRGSDIAITYVLLLPAVGMEVAAFLYMLLSLWTYGTMKKLNICNRIADTLFSVQLILRPKERSRWSQKMAQFSLITYALEDKPCWWKSIIQGAGFKHTWDNYRYTTFVVVSEELKKLVCEELKNKIVDIDQGSDGYRRCTQHRGQWALQRKGYYKEFGWSVEVDFDESIVLWHVATDLLFHDPTVKVADQSSTRNRQSLSRDISNYLMFLLIGRPFMMPAGIGQVRFGDTSAEAKNFLQYSQDDDDIKDVTEAVKKIMGVSTKYHPAEIKGDRSKSLLFNACKLAHDLKTAFSTENNGSHRMWSVLSVQWVEMLCYAASKCSGQFHARQLSKGGELLTIVWFLMAHLGMGEQYRIEEGHARAKLVISK